MCGNVCVHIVPCEYEAIINSTSIVHTVAILVFLVLL